MAKLRRWAGGLTHAIALRHAKADKCDITDVNGFYTGGSRVVKRRETPEILMTKC